MSDQKLSVLRVHLLFEKIYGSSSSHRSCIQHRQRRQRTCQRKFQTINLCFFRILHNLISNHHSYGPDRLLHFLFRTVFSTIFRLVKVRCKNRVFDQFAVMGETNWCRKIFLHCIYTRMHLFKTWSHFNV